MDRDVIFHIIGVYANFSLFANIIKVASKEKQIFCRKLLLTEKERIDFAKNHSLHMN